ncbi:MAG: hypothetical protein E7327_01680 [Clostridiales bacterium]|nr:hypothetical protein [Clostridiales bacterium]
MKTIHRLMTLCAVLCLMLLPAAVLAEIAFGPDLSGVFCYPEGSDETTALYVYRYCYPQMAGDSDLAALINTTYAYTAEDALGFEVPMLASEMQPGDPQKLVSISYEITCLNDDHLSLKIIKRVTIGGDETNASTVTSGHVFALSGSGTGRIVNLPVLLGLLDAEETDEWLLTRQTDKATRYARDMVWERLTGSGKYQVYDDLTREEFDASFYPEEDFYLTQEGDICFFLQAGMVAPEEEGEIGIVISAEELLDEM